MFDNEILYQQRYDDTAATAALEGYMRRWLGVTVARYKVTTEDYDNLITYPLYDPVRFAVITDVEEVEHPCRWQKGTIVSRKAVPIGLYTITYSAGYGQLDGILPADLPADLPNSISDDLQLPADIALATKQLNTILTDRGEQVTDREGYDGGLGSEQLTGAEFRYTIPEHIKGLVMNRRRRIVG